jgi:AhpD family alkylhydroperoxidase
MARLRPVPRDEAAEGIVTVMYDFIFGDRDPVAEPGLSNGTPGDWWTVVAQSPELMAHCVSGFAFYRSEEREVPADLRELAQLRTGWARGSRFVLSQHSKAARDNGVAEEKIAAIEAWQVSDAYTPAERAVLAWTDALVLQGGRADDATFAALREHLSELAILELTYITCWYDLHAVMSKALRLELDDVDDRITELTGPGIARSLRPDAEVDPA